MITIINSIEKYELLKMLINLEGKLLESDKYYFKVMFNIEGELEVREI